MSKPIGFFVSARAGTFDAAYLSQIEQQFGSHLEHLTSTQIAAWVVTLVSKVVEPQGVEVEIAIDNYNLEPLFSLSDSAKLDLAVAALSYLCERGMTAGKDKHEVMPNANLR